MQPVVAGDDRTDRSRTWTEAEVRERYRRKAGTLAEAGVDVLVMEMMRDTGESVWATEAAMETGLPVWVGLSFEPGPDGGLVGWGRPESAMDDVIAALTATGPDLVAVMHTAIDDTGQRWLPCARGTAGRSASTPRAAASPCPTGSSST